MRRRLIILMAMLACGLLPTVRAAEVGLINIKGAIGPATAGYITRAIGVAALRSNACLIVQLDTPGGLLESTKDIVQTFYSASVPIVVYVAPSGATATASKSVLSLETLRGKR